MEENSPPPSPVRQLRLVVEADDFDAALVFYRDALGLPQQAAFEGEGDARVAILHAGVATLEISNRAQVQLIDLVEADGRPSARIRVAFEVNDTAGTTSRLVGAGAVLTAAPRVTPWHSVNSRMDAPAGLEVTLFQELKTLEQRSQLSGFNGRDSQGSKAPKGRTGGRLAAVRPSGPRVQITCSRDP